VTLKLHCPSCGRESPIDGFAIEGSELALACPCCSRALRVDGTGAVRVHGEVASDESASAAGDEEAASAAGDDEAASAAGGEPTSTAGDTMECPKCGERQPPATACRSCGLLAERMADFAHDDEGEDEVAELWVAVEERWDHDDVHEAYLARIVERGAYAVAARRYRKRARTGDTRAQSYLERVGRMAQVGLTRPTQVAEDGKEPFRGVAILLLVLLVVGGAVGTYAIVKFRSHGGSEAPRPSGLGSRR